MVNLIVKVAATVIGLQLKGNYKWARKVRGWRFYIVIPIAITCAPTALELLNRGT